MSEEAKDGATPMKVGSSEPAQETTTNGDVTQAEGAADSNAQQSDATEEQPTAEEPPGDPKSTEEDGEHHAIFVMNIPLTASEADVKKHFEEEVAVKSVSMVYTPSGQFRGCANIELPNKWAYEGALKMMGTKLDSLYLYVVPHRSMNKPENNDRDEAKLLKILVSNIPKSISITEAKQHFYPAGRFRRFIAKVSGKRAKNDAFEEDWTATIKVKNLDTFTNLLKMDGSLLGGQAIKVEPLVADLEGVYKSLAEAEPNFMKRGSDSEELKLSDFEDEDEEDDNDEASRFKLFVANIPSTIEPKTLSELMSQAGEVVSCWMPEEYSTKKRPKLAVVTMADEESYKKGLELAGTKLEENPLKISPYVRGKLREGRKVADPLWLKKPLILVLSNIPFKTTEDELKKHFESAGDIVCVRFPKDKTIHAAYMELRDGESYEKALAMSNTFLGQHCITVMATTSNLVPKNWLDLAAQKEANRRRVLPFQKPRKPKEEGADQTSKDSEAARKARKNRNAKRRKWRRRQEEREEEDDYGSGLPPAKMMKRSPSGGNVSSSPRGGNVKSSQRGGNTNNQRGGKSRGGNMKSRGSNMMGRGGYMKGSPRGGNMNLAAYDHYVTSYGGGLYADSWGGRSSGGSSNYRSGTFKRPSAMLEEAKRKEIEQVALAALTELQARKSGSGMGSYGDSSSRFGSSDYGSRYGNSYRSSDPRYY